MIGSFWNLCRACPSMPVDKQLHSEYRSTYRWHEFTGNSRPEVVRRAPVPNPNQFVGQTNEPSMPRRKKCPELAYKSHEFIIGTEYTDARNLVAANRLARSNERGGTPSRRSKSEGPPAVPNGRAYPIPTEVDGVATKQAGESNGLLKKTFTKLSTEYRLQFVWPSVRKSIKGPKPNDAAAGAVDHPKKSQSMGALIAQQQQQTMMPTVHKKRTANKKEATLHELEPLVSDAEDRKPHEKQVTIMEKKSAHAARPFSQTFDLERNNHFITRKENFGFDEQRAAFEMDKKQYTMLNGSAPPHSQPNLELWFKEVVELRKKAGEYKSRGWGVEIDPELYKKQRELWDQVSKRSSLSALSLASSIHRPITKEEKEQENNKKTLPLTPAAHTTTTKPRVPGHAHLIDNRIDEMTALPARFNNIRHHLERTTGPDVEEGALLPSPTREKLMPAITKRESESQRGSPKKTAASRHGSPQKGSPQKGSPKKTLKSRSQSVGPGESPKRQLRSASTAPATRVGITGKKTPVAQTPATTATTPGAASERKARPSTLSTTIHSRTKSSSLPPSGRTHSVTGGNAQLHHSVNQSQSSNQTSPHALHMRKKDKDKENSSYLSKGLAVKPRPKSSIDSAATSGVTASKAANTTTNTNTKNGANKLVLNVEPISSALKHLAVPGRDKKLVENEGEDGRETAISISSCSPQPVPEIPDEPIVKSPPEPTRVKSPEQIIMRSPDPVNWTVPLDTGKTFTVTQNVKEGETYSRPQSEIKASTPVEKPPPPPQSAPPELTEQVKMDAWKHADFSERKSPTASSPTSFVGKQHAAITTQPLLGQAQAQMSKAVPGSTLRCLDDPSLIFDADATLATATAAIAGGSPSSASTSTTATTARSAATDVLEKARDRFDRFWGGNKEDAV